MTSFIQQQQRINDDEILFSNERFQKRSIFSGIYRSKASRGVLCLLVFSLTVPVLVFFYLIHHDSNPTTETARTCLVDPIYRVPCGVPHVTENQCSMVACCYDEDTKECYHYLPSTYTYTGRNDRYESSQPKTPFGNEVLDGISVTLNEVDENRLEVVLHEPSLQYDSKTVPSKNYKAIVYKENLYVEVRRNETSDLIFTTAKGPLITSKGFWEWTFQLTTENLYGLGEIHFEGNTTYTKVIYKNKNDHNTLPIFMAYLNGRFHGAVVEHDGPLEVTVLPSKLIILRSLVGSRISITLSLGPTPVDVVQQQGVKDSVVPPVWSLGPHICRRGGTTMASALAEYESFKANENNTIDYASDCIHEDLLVLLNNATQDEKARLSTAISELRNKSRLLISVPPQVDFSQNVLYEKAVLLNMLYKLDDEVFNGTFNMKSVVYPDFLNDKVSEFLETFVMNLPKEGYDGFVLTSNWPGEDSYVMNNDDKEFPYVSPFMLSAMSSTIPWNAFRNTKETHIFNHNSYGSSQTHLIESITDGFLMTSSYTYRDPYATHLDNIDISWADLRKAISTSLYHSVFGSPLISIPVCGSTDNYNRETHESVCIRWYIFAATSPIFRISSDWPRRDPTAVGSGFARLAVEDAIHKREQLIPYYFSLLNSKEPIMRPMFYDFYDDNVTLDLTEQYMVGSALLFAQPVGENLKYLDVYLPPSAETWYEFWGGMISSSLGWVRVHVLETDWITFIAAGHVISLQRTNGDDASRTTLTLAVALKCSLSGCFASGTLNLGTVAMAFKANDTGISVGNVNAVHEHLGCDKRSGGFSFIYDAQIYGLEESLVTSNFSGVDLCEVKEDEYFIKYFE